MITRFEVQEEDRLVWGILSWENSWCQWEYGGGEMRIRVFGKGKWGACRGLHISWSRFASVRVGDF